MNNHLKNYNLSYSLVEQLISIETNLQKRNSGLVDLVRNGNRLEKGDSE